jgi:prevent-host-death family protein
MERIWQLQQAKARLSELVQKAVEGEPQVVTRHGHRAVVVLDYERYQQLAGQHRSLWEVLRGEQFLTDEEADQLSTRPADGYREVDL